MKKIFLFVVILVLFQSGYCVNKTVLDLFGKTYIDVIRTQGFPNAMFPVRQSTPEKDDVVFVYEDSFFYFYSNRMYRAFYSSKYPGEIYKGIKIGDPKSKLTSIFGSKYDLEKDGLVWMLDKVMVIAKIGQKNNLETLWFITKVDK